MNLKIDFIIPASTKIISNSTRNIVENFGVASLSESDRFRFCSYSMISRNIIVLCVCSGRRASHRYSGSRPRLSTTSSPLEVHLQCPVLPKLPTTSQGDSSRPPRAYIGRLNTRRGNAVYYLTNHFLGELAVPRCRDLRQDVWESTRRN